MYNNKRFTVIMSPGGGGNFGTTLLTQRHIFCHSGSYSLMEIELTLVGEKFLA